MSALKYLKTLGIIHCDLKPENILLKSKEKSGIVVADFGSGTLDEEIVYTYI
jgi:serine/threonine protein kinase